MEPMRESRLEVNGASSVSGSKWDLGLSLLEMPMHM